MKRPFKAALLAFAILVFSSVSPYAHDQEKPAETDIAAVTVSDPKVPLDELKLMVKPLTVEELKVEAEAWMELLREKTRQTTQAEIAIKQKNKRIDQAEEVQEAIEETQEILEKAEDASLEAQTTGDIDSAEDASALADQARDAVAETADSIQAAIEERTSSSQQAAVADAISIAEKTRIEVLEDNTEAAREASEEASIAADRALDAARVGDTEKATRYSEVTAETAAEVAARLDSTSEVIDQAIAAQQSPEVAQVEEGLTKTAELAAAVAQKEMADKKDILLSVTELRNQRTNLSDRLAVVLDELSRKMGTTPEGEENEYIVPFRLYAASVNALEVDVTDTQSALSNILGWLRSDVGGLRLAKNLGYFVVSVVGFWALGWLLGRLVDRTLKITRITAELMRSVIVRSVRNVTVAVGIIVGLAAMDINVGPILAIIGAAGFVIAFALQDTLSNFASGIMIMIYRPFDVGDLVTVGGVTGEARSMNLVSTTIATRDNQLLVIPNNTVWQNIITNITGSEMRRVDMVFRIAYRDDIGRAQEIMEEVLKDNPLVLEEPEWSIGVQTLGPVAVDMICRPWSKTEDYWIVYREVTKAIKERFQAAGLHPPYLDRDLNLPAPLPDQDSVQPTYPIS